MPRKGDEIKPTRSLDSLSDLQQELFLVLKKALAALKQVTVLSASASDEKARLRLIDTLSKNGEQLKRSLIDRGAKKIEGRAEKTFEARVLEAMDPRTWTYAGQRRQYSSSENVYTVEELKRASDTTEETIKVILGQEIALGSLGEDLSSGSFRDLSSMIEAIVKCETEPDLDQPTLDQLTKLNTALEKEIRLLSGKTTWLEAALDIPITLGVVLADTLAVLVAVPIVVVSVAAVATMVSAMYCMAAISAAVRDLGNYLFGGVINSARNGLVYGTGQLQEQAQEERKTFTEGRSAELCHGATQSVQSVQRKYKAVTEELKKGDNDENALPSTLRLGPKKH